MPKSIPARPLEQLKSRQSIEAATYVAQLVASRGLPITGAMIDNQSIGSFWFRLLKHFTANTDTTFSHGLGRIPTIYIQSGASVAGELYDGSANRADWTSSTIVLRASATGNFSFLIA